MKKHEALLVIDMDHRDGWKDTVDELDSGQKQVALAIRETLQAWRAAGGLVIFIVFYVELRQSAQQVSWDSKQPGCIACNEDKRLAEFLEHRHGDAYEPVFVKTSDDAFTNAELIRFLRAQGITKLYLAGCLTDCCVLATAQGAVRHGLDVTLLEPCAYPRLLHEEFKQEWGERANRVRKPVWGSLDLRASATVS